MARSTVFVWLGEGPDHVPGKPGPKDSRKIDRQKLRQALEKEPDLMLSELAQRFGVCQSTVSYNAQRLVYLDETGFALSSHRLHGRAPKGQRVYGLQNGQQRPRTSLIGGYCNHKLIAPMLFEGNCNTEVFNQWIQHMAAAPTQYGQPDRAGQCRVPQIGQHAPDS